MTNKPCPFCGKPVDLDDPDTLHPSGIYWCIDDGFKHYNHTKSDHPCWIMNCTETSGGCGVEIHADTRDEALLKWDKRVLTSPTT